MQLPEELQFMANARMKQKTTDARLDGKTCIITGATSGVGYVAARRFAQGGANLILVCRNREKAERTKSQLQKEFDIQVNLFCADFSDLSQVSDVATKILELFPHIDILINNVGMHNTKRVLTPDGFEIVFCVNHLASFLLTSLLLPRLIESAPAKIIQVNSEGHRFGGLDLNDLTWEKRRYKGLKGYGAAKTAQLLTVWEFADQLKGKGVTINAMHPGAVATNIGMNNGFLYRNYQKYILFPLLKDPKISGEALYYLAASPEMTAVSGKFYNLTIEEKTAAHALDRELGKQVWQISQELTQIVN